MAYTNIIVIRHSANGDIIYQSPNSLNAGSQGQGLLRVQVPFDNTTYTGSMTWSLANGQSIAQTFDDVSQVTIDETIYYQYDKPIGDTITVISANNATTDLLVTSAFTSSNQVLTMAIANIPVTAGDVSQLDPILPDTAALLAGNKRAKDPTALSAETVITDADVITFYDTSTLGEKKITGVNLRSTITAALRDKNPVALSALTTLADADLITMWDSDASVEKKITFASLIAQLATDIEWVLTDTVADKLVTFTYDSSDTGGNAVSINYLAEFGSVSLQIGQENWVHGYNVSGVTITNGKAVSIVGSQGNRPTVELATNASDIVAHQTIGIATQDITNNGYGKVTTFGLVKGLNIGTGFSEGDTIYLGVDGALLNAEPTAPIPHVELGVVVKVTGGAINTIFVTVDKLHKMGAMSDVDISTAVTGDIIRKNSSDVWVPYDIATDLALKEDKSNIVTAFSTPLDTEYPSAKLTSDQLALKAPQATTYTKTEVDSKVAALYKFKGSVATYAGLAAKESTAISGDVWNVTADETTGNSGVNYAWTGTAWDNIGGVEALASATNNGLMSKEDFSKLLALPTNAELDIALGLKANATETETALGLKIDKDFTGYNALASGAINGVDILPIHDLDGAETKKVTVSDLETYFNISGGIFDNTSDYESTGLGAYDSAVLDVHTVALDVNGKYKCTIKTMETDKNIWFEFPVISGNTNDLSLSTDNGLLYYDVLINGGTIQSNLFSERRIMFYFDGTNFIVSIDEAIADEVKIGLVNHAIVVPQENSQPQYKDIKGMTLNSIAYATDVIDTGTINFDSVSGIDYYDWLNSVIIAGTGSNIVVTNNTGVTADMMIVIITNTAYSTKSATELDILIPTYFEGIASVSKDLAVKSVGTQLLDESNIIDGSRISETTGAIITSGASSRTDYISIAPNADYTIAPTVNANTRYALYDSSKIFISGGISVGATTIIIKATNQAYIIISDVTTNLLGNNMQLEKGTVATAYKDYATATTTFHFLDDLRSVGSVEDIAGGGVVTKKVGRDFNDVVKGGTGWFLNFPLTTTQVFEITLSSLLGYKIPLSSGTLTNIKLKIGNIEFVTDTASVVATIDTVNTIGIASNGSILVRVDKTTYQNATAFKAYLQANDVEFIFEVETPIIEEYIESGDAIAQLNSQYIIEGTVIIPQEQTIEFATTVKDMLNQAVIETRENSIEIDALKVETTFLKRTGWIDLLGEPKVFATGANDPTYAIYTGSIRQFKFATNAMNELYFAYHIPHGYVEGTDMFIHTHWSTPTVDAGDVKWYYDITYAKGYDQAPFSTPITVSVVQSGSATAFNHQIAEVQFTDDGTSLINKDELQTDGLLLVRMYRDPADVADTIAVSPFVHYVDIHLQNNKMVTANRNYPFE